jgi:hypothetical protein
VRRVFAGHFYWVRYKDTAETAFFSSKFRAGPKFGREQIKERRISTVEKSQPSVFFTLSAARQPADGY